MSGSSTSSRSSSRSSRKTSTSRRSSVTVKSTAVDLPRKHTALSLVLWCAGADPRRIRHLRKEEIAYDNSDWDGSSRSGSSSHFGGDARTKTKWVFVSDTYEDYYYYNYGSNADDESTFSGRSKSKRSSPSRQSRRGSARPRDDPVWQNRRPQQQHDGDDYSDSDSDDSEDSDGQYGGPIPPPPPPMHAGMPMGGPPPPGFYNIPPQGPPPQHQPPAPFVDDEEPGFFQIR